MYLLEGEHVTLERVEGGFVPASVSCACTCPSFVRRRQCAEEREGTACAGLRACTRKHSATTRTTGLRTCTRARGRARTHTHTNPTDLRRAHTAARAAASHQALNPAPHTPHPTPHTPHPAPRTPNPEHRTPNTEPATRLGRVDKAAKAGHVSDRCSCSRKQRASKSTDPPERPGQRHRAGE